MRAAALAVPDLLSAAPLAALDLVTAGVCSLLVVAGVRNRDRPGSLAASSLWAVLALVAVGFAAGRLDLVSGPATVGVGFLGWVLAVALWAGFVFSYTHRGPTLTRRWSAIAACYVTVVAVTTLYSTAVGETGGEVRLAMAVSQTLLVGVGLFGVFLVVRSGRVDTGVSGWQALSLSVGGLCVTLLLFTVSTLDATDPGTLPATATGALATAALAFAVSAFAVGLFDGAPTTGPLARQTLLERMEEAVVVIDREGRLVDANAAAERTFDIALAAEAGRPAASVVGVDIDAVAEGPVTISTARGTRSFAVSRSELTSRRGETVGRSYLFRDVTDQQMRRQRLEVLERVLRHNLRNDLDAIRGFAEALSDGIADEPGELTGRIDELAVGLVEVGETVDRADRIMRERLAHESVDLGDLARSVVADVGRRYEFESAVSVADGSAAIRTDPEVLRAALGEVVENAAEHSDSSVPTVRIEIACAGNTGRITVRDDGPGIPERERRVLLEGEEDPLRHGLGVGLWFVSWAVTRLGGDLDLHAPADGGSEVALTVPDRRE